MLVPQQVLRRSPMHPFWSWAALVLACGDAPSAAQRIDFTSLLAELADLRAHCEFPEPPFVCRESSSTDPRSITATPGSQDWFANSDAGHFVRVDERDGRREGVLLDAQGPGALVRLWSANPKGTLRIYLDGAETPALEEAMARLLTGKGPVPPPIAAERARGANLYLPLPYAKRCVVTCDQPDGLAYSCTYRTWPEGTDVASFAHGDLESHAGEIAAMCRALVEPAPDPRAQVRPFEVLLVPGDGPGALRVLSLDVDAPPASDEFPSGTPQAITELSLEISPDPPSPSAEARQREAVLRTTILSLTFDGRETVRVPLGDFFGSAPGLNPYASLPMEVRASGEMVCRFPMPFRERATVRVEALGSERALVRGKISTSPYPWTERTLTFHAQWKKSGAIATRPVSDWRLASIRGRGVWVGDMLSVGNPALAWWGEGDEKIRVDLEPAPSHFGTGTDAYYGFAWCWPQRFEDPLHNQTRCDGPQNFGYTSVNRFRALDSIPFTSALDFDMELWHWSAGLETSLAATAWFYAAPDATHDAPAPDAMAREGVPALIYEPFRVPGALEAEALEIAAKSEGLELELEPLPDTAEGKWSGGAQLSVHATQKGQFVELRVPVATAGRHELFVYATRGWDHATLAFSIDGAPAGEPLETFREAEGERLGPPERHSLGVFDLPSPSFVLRAEVVGTNERSRPPHHAFGIDCIVLQPVQG